MGKKLTDQSERIVQRSIGFARRQFDFFDKYPDFKPDSYCRNAIDEQIKLIDTQFLKDGEKATDNN